MEIEGSVRLEIRPKNCPLQKSICLACKYLADTYLEKDEKEGRLVATIFCKWGEHQKE